LMTSWTGWNAPSRSRGKPVALWRPDARAGPIPGGGFYGPPNINVGYIVGPRQRHQNPLPYQVSNGLFPESLQITPATLAELAPRLSPYMPPRTDDMTWPAIIEAALWLSGELGINRTLWARACQMMGREYAAVALAIVSTRPAGHFTSGPGAFGPEPHHAPSQPA
jgi:hypothetical protein